MKKTLALVICTVLSGICLAADAPGFKVTKRYPVPGNGGFDYIVFDSSSDRLYVSHGTEVNVLDASSGKVLGKIENTPAACLTDAWKTRARLTTILCCRCS